MGDFDDLENKVVQLMARTTPKTQQTGESDGSRLLNSVVVSINGNGNAVAGGDINLNVGPAPKPKIIVKTGDGVIDASQKAELRRRLDQWLTARNAVRKSRMTHGAGWNAFNKAMDVNSYAELKPEQMPAALAWFGKQMAILRGMKSAPTKIKGFRYETMGAIKARAKQLGDLHYYTPYIVKTYGLSSLAHLSDRQLQEVRAWIFAQKRN